jgi:hypothetical protein
MVGRCSTPLTTGDGRPELRRRSLSREGAGRGEGDENCALQVRHHQLPSPVVEWVDAAAEGGYIA